MNRFFKPFRRRTTGIPPTSSRAPDPHEQPMIDAVPIGPGLIYPDMLPDNVWGSNLRGILPKMDWNRLRTPVCEQAENRCEVCRRRGYDPDTGRPRRPDCHELWHFEVSATSAVQRLARLIALCADCHRVQHLGLAGVRGEQSLVKMQLKAVNSWSDAEIMLALGNAGARFFWRSTFEWDLDLSFLGGRIRVDGCPNLLISATDRRRLGNSHFER